MKGLLVIVLLAGIYFTLKILQGLHGGMGAFIVTAIIGAIIALVAWGRVRILSKKNE